MWMGIREVMGWLIALIGTALIGVVLLLALNRSVIEAAALSLPAAVVFRAGIGLVRMTTAARIATDLSRRDKQSS